MVGHSVRLRWPTGILSPVGQKSLVVRRKSTSAGRWGLLGLAKTKKRMSI